MFKLAVVGKDVSQSKSPEIHAFIAKNLGLELAYEKLSVPEDKFEGEIQRILKEYDGFNVTIPYKISIIKYLKKIDGDAFSFGAVNTVKCSTLTGYNTDGLGFAQLLKEENISVKGKNALVIGAGGAGRSVAKKLLDLGASVQIYNRSFGKAEKVAIEFKGITALKQINAEERYLIVNASGVGMHETVGISPVSNDILSRCEAAVDLIYEPEKSEFLIQAENLGKKTANGAAMLFYQAYFADCIFFGLQADMDDAKKLFEKFRKERL